MLKKIFFLILFLFLFTAKAYAVSPTLSYSLSGSLTASNSASIAFFTFTASPDTITGSDLASGSIAYSSGSFSGSITIDTTVLTGSAGTISGNGGSITYDSSNNTFSGSIPDISLSETLTQSPVCSDGSAPTNGACSSGAYLTCPTGYTLSGDTCSEAVTGSFTLTGSGSNIDISGGNSSGSISMLQTETCPTGYKVSPPGTTPVTCVQNTYGGTASSFGCTSDGINFQNCLSGSLQNTCNAQLCPIQQTQCKNNTTPVVCPSGYTYNPPTVPTCPAGYTLSSSTGQCAETTSSTVASVTDYSCPTGYTYNSTTSTCTGTDIQTVPLTLTYSCPAGYASSGSTCTKTTTYTASPTVTYSCPSGYTLSGTTCSETLTQAATPSCPSGYTYDSSTGQCTETLTQAATPSCPSGYTLSGTTCTETTTTNNLTFSGNIDYEQSPFFTGQNNTISAGVASGFIGAITYSNGSFGGSLTESGVPMIIGSGNSITGTGVTYSNTSGNYSITFLGSITYSGGSFSGTIYYNAIVNSVNTTTSIISGQGSNIVGVSAGDMTGTISATPSATTTTTTATPTYSCPSGYTLSGTTCSETNTATPTYSCPTGYTLSGTTCSETLTQAATPNYSCPSGYTYDSSTGQCTDTTTQTSPQTPTPTCPSGYSWNGAVCTESTNQTATPTSAQICPTGYTLDSSTGQCAKTTTLTATPTCQSGYTLSGSTCTETSQGQCGANQTSSPGQCTETTTTTTSSTCPSGYTFNGSTCVETTTQTETPTCPTGYTFNGSTCVELTTSPTAWTTAITDNELEALYLGLLARPADPQGEAYWYNTGATASLVAQGIGPYAEYYSANNGSNGVAISSSNINEEFVNLYTDMLGFTPPSSSQGINFWSNAFNTEIGLGMTPGAALGFIADQIFNIVEDFPSDSACINTKLYMNSAIATAQAFTNASPDVSYSAPGAPPLPSSYFTEGQTIFTTTGYTYTSSNTGAACQGTNVQTAIPICPSGYTFNGSACTQSTTQTATPTCPSGYAWNGSTCTQSTTQTATPTCPSGSTLTGGQCVSQICPLNGTPQGQSPAQNYTCVEPTGSSNYYCSPYLCYNSTTNTPVNTPETLPPPQTNNAPVTSSGCTGSIYIFPGEALQCTRFYILGENCCSRSKFLLGGRNCSANSQKLAEAVIYDNQYSPPVPVYSGSGDPSTAPITSCSPSSIINGCGQQGEAVYIGDYCSYKLPIVGTCLAHSYVFCKFSGLLATIIQAQGREQLAGGTEALSWGSVSSPNCSGLSPSQFQALNFNQINLTEYIGVIKNQVNSTLTQSAISAQITNTTISINNEIQQLSGGQ